MNRTEFIQRLKYFLISEGLAFNQEFFIKGISCEANYNWVYRITENDFEFRKSDEAQWRIWGVNHPSSLQSAIDIFVNRKISVITEKPRAVRKKKRRA